MKDCIEILNNYKGANGKRYVSDYRAILSWVIKRYREEQERSHQCAPPPSNGGYHHKETVNERNNRLIADFFGIGKSNDNVIDYNEVQVQPIEAENKTKSLFDGLFGGSGLSG